MKRENISSIFDEAVNKLDNEIRIKRTQVQTLTINIEDLEKRRNSLSQEIADSEQKLSNVKKQYKDEVDTVLKSAQEKLNNVTAKEANVSEKSAELDKKLEEVNGLIKSNEGKEKNLVVQEIEAKGKIQKLNSLIELIKKTIQDM